MSTSSERPRRRKELGQCFLEDRNVLALEARLAAPEGKRVLEIGPGDGRLTDAMLALGPVKVLAVEKDPRFAAILREKYKTRSEVEIAEADFLDFEPPAFDVVVGNIPYYISSDIIFRLARLSFERGVLMVQKEFAEKMCATPGSGTYGRLSVTSQIAFDVRLERPVLRHLFRPVPKVDSAIILIRPTGVRLSAFQENVIRAMFQHKNKTVRNALLDSKAFAREEIGSLGSFAGRRAKTLTKEECLEISGLLENV